MKIALITDCHVGVRKNSLILHNYFEKFYSKVFFPYLDKHGIRQVICLGDMFDSRNGINFHSLDLAKKYLFNPLRDREIEMDEIVGNHDAFFFDSLVINSPRLLLKEYKNIHIIDSPQPKIYDGLEILLIPWICRDNEDITFDVIQKTKAQICFGHLQIQGFKMHMHLTECVQGLGMSLFDKFDIVASGHFHHKSTYSNINYLGAPYEMTWADYNDRRGFHVFDTETRNLEFIQNPYRLFHKIHYDENIKIDPNHYENCYVKVIIRNKSNPVTFDKFIESLEKVNAADLQVVEDHFNLNEMNDSDIIEEAEDTINVIKNVIKQLDMNVNKESLETLMKNLYEQAINQEG